MTNDRDDDCLQHQDDTIAIDGILPTAVSEFMESLRRVNLRNLGIIFQLYGQRSSSLVV